MVQDVRAELGIERMDEPARKESWIQRLARAKVKDIGVERRVIQTKTGPRELKGEGYAGQAGRVGRSVIAGAGVTRKVGGFVSRRPRVASRAPYGGAVVRTKYKSVGGVPTRTVYVKPHAKPQEFPSWLGVGSDGVSHPFFRESRERYDDIVFGDHAFLDPPEKKGKFKNVFRGWGQGQGDFPDWGL